MRARIVSIAAGLVAACAVPVWSADAIATGNGGNVSLARNWGPYETYQGASFRWVDNDAELVLHGTRGATTVSVTCEGGPSLGRTAFPLRVLDDRGRQVDHVDCAGAGKPSSVSLPGGDGTRYRLHADGGGRRIPNLPRILNFRVFSLDAGGTAPGAAGDIVDPGSGVRLGARWYPAEHFGGQTFRWVHVNDAQLFVRADRARTARLRLVAEAGPSAGTTALQVSIVDAHGRMVAQTTVGRRRPVEATVRLQAGENPFTVHFAGGRNLAVPHDPRLLALRVFSITTLR